MGLYHCIEELFSKAYGDGLFRVTKVTDDRHIILCRSLPYHSVQLFLFLRIVVYHPTARYYIMRKVLYRIILRRIAELACFRVHLNQSILFPSPGLVPLSGRRKFQLNHSSHPLPALSLIRKKVCSPAFQSMLPLPHSLSEQM